METRTRKRERLEEEEDANQRINQRSLLNILDDCTMSVNDLVCTASYEKVFRESNIQLVEKFIQESRSCAECIAAVDCAEVEEAVDIIRNGQPDMSTILQAVKGLDKMLAALRQQITDCPALSRRP